MHCINGGVCAHRELYKTCYTADVCSLYGAFVTVFHERCRSVLSVSSDRAARGVENGKETSETYRKQHHDIHLR